LEEILQQGCVDQVDERMAPMMLAWGALLRKLSPSDREPRKPIGANQFWDEARLWGGECVSTHPFRVLLLLNVCEGVFHCHRMLILSRLAFQVSRLGWVCQLWSPM
jgi:hypothetical protein